MFKLYAARYEDSDSNPAMLEFIEQPANVGIRASLPGWVKTIEVTVRAGSRLDAYYRYKEHLGQRIAILDHLLDRPVADGRIYEVVPDGRFVHYICAGPWKEHERELDVTSYTTTNSLDTVLKAMLTAHVSVLSSDQSNIDANSTQIGSVWDTKSSTGGITPAEAITELLEMSDSSGNVWDYWTISDYLDGVTLGQPIPYYKARSAAATVNWRCDLADLRSISMSRHIWSLQRDVTVYYGTSPTATAGSISTETDLWTVQTAPRQARFALTQGNQHEDKVLAVYEKPIQQQDFTIGAPLIRAANNAGWPLWELIKRGPGYIRINDLYPALTTFGKSLDRESVFFTNALDYDYSSNTLRVVPDNPDSRLDALLARENNITEAKGEMVQRYDRGRGNIGALTAGQIGGIGNRR